MHQLEKKHTEKKKVQGFKHKLTDDFLRFYNIMYARMRARVCERDHHLAYWRLYDEILKRIFRSDGRQVFVQDGDFFLVVPPRRTANTSISSKPNQINRPPFFFF